MVRAKCVASIVLCVPIAICHARTVSTVTVEQAGQTSAPDDPLTRDACKNFKPTVAQLKRFFSRAAPIDGRFVAHDYYSPCHSDGAISFPDGSSGRWRVYSSGTASLTWASSDNTVYLYNGRNNGWHDPFACSYGLHDEDDDTSCYLPGF